MSFNIFFLASFLFFSSNFALYASSPCDVPYDQGEYFYKVNECDSNGRVTVVKEYFSQTNQLSSETYLDSYGRKDKKISYSIEGEISLREYEYSSETFVETIYEKDSSSRIKAKFEYEIETNNKLRSWEYRDAKAVWVDSFSPKNTLQIIKRHFLDEEKIYHIQYKPESRYGDEVQSFVVTNTSGKEMGRYKYGFDGDVERILKGQFTGDELDFWLTNYRDTQRLPVAVIDSGFDLRHPAITPYLYNNPAEAWSSKIDLDGNGLVGDVFGQSTTAFGKRSSNINEPIITGSFKPLPMSHGTHVASIAMKGLEGVGLLGFSGDVGNPNHLKMVSKDLSYKQIRLANMSWGFKEAGAPLTPGTRTYTVLKEMINKNTQTLFHVAAGNNAWDLDRGQKDYPASYPHNNLLVVGALNVSDYNWEGAKNLKPAVFESGLGSNTGALSVDVFAPGKEVLGAQIGGGMIKKSGTSMASPYALNISSRVLKILPSLSTLELKELVMKSVGYTKNPLPCVSEGFIHPKRAVSAAKLLAQNTELSIEAAILKVREQENQLYLGEIEPSNEQLSIVWDRVDSSLQ